LDVIAAPGQLKRSMASLLSTLVVIVSCCALCPAQRPVVTDIYVEGWKTGNKTSEQLFTFDLDSSQQKRTANVSDLRQVPYKLVLTKFPAGKEVYQLEYWVVELRPVISKGNAKRLGDNLLTAEGPGPGGDNFPREDLVGILYPQESPKNIVEKMRQPNGGYYPISARRVVKVENFYVIIQVDSFKLSEANLKKIDSMHVTIRFTNIYRPAARLGSPPSNNSLDASGGSVFLNLIRPAMLE
jgi:hypothetical protein